MKSKRSIEKPKEAGPAAYVLTGDDPRPGSQAELLRVLQIQGCEISRATAPFTVEVPAKKPAAREGATSGPAGGGGRQAPEKAEKAEKKDEPVTRQFPAGTYIVRMDQPYSRIADALLDYQYWAPDDPQSGRTTTRGGRSASCSAWTWRA